MDGGSILAVSAIMYGAVSGVTLFATKKIIGSAIKGISERIDREREDRLRNEKDLWDTVNKHGHKGLDGNSARVTR